MKFKLLFAASAVALIVGLVSIVLVMEMYDVKPQTWGPQGVAFEEWHRAWSAVEIVTPYSERCPSLLRWFFA